MIAPDELTAIPLFADLTADQLDFLARSVEDIWLLPGEFAAHEDDDRAFFVVVEGLIELTKNINGVERVIGPRLPGEVIGEVPMMLSTNLPASVKAAETTRILKLDVKTFFGLATMAPQVADAVGTLAKGRIEGLKEIAAETAKPDMTIIGPLVDPRVHVVRTFLNRNNITFESINTTDATVTAADAVGPVTAADAVDPVTTAVTTDAVSAATTDTAPATAPTSSTTDTAPRFPVVELADGRRLIAPTVREIAVAGGLPVVPASDSYDVVIIGGGPTGLTAAVNGAAEGLRTLVVERFAPGGQAGTSTRIENYTGFPFGVSGDELASKALRQANRLGAEIVVTRAVESIDSQAGTLTLDGGAELATKAVILTSGVEWRHLPLDSIDHFVGNGVYYGAARSDSGLAQGTDVFIIGAGNSAGQAAIFFSRHSKSVTLVVRGESLAASMSQYLIEQIAANPRITVETGSQVVGLHGDDYLEAVDVLDKRTQTVTRRATSVLFVMIGADAETSWLPPQIARDAHGYVLTGPDARDVGGWVAARDPFALETTAPGIFAAGDVRSGSVKRVAAGVGEGGMAIAFVHQFLALDA